MAKRRFVLPILLCLAVLLGTVVVAESGQQGDRSQYQVRSSVIGSGGSPMSSRGARLNGTAAQPTPIGVSTARLKILYAGFWKSALLGPSAVDPDLPIAYRNGLYPSRPNPAREMIWIPYSLAREGSVELRVHDATGRTVRTLVSGRVPAGNHYAVWDGRDASGAPVASGVYFYRVVMSDYASSRKMMLIR